MIIPISQRNLDRRISNNIGTPLEIKWSSNLQDFSNTRIFQGFFLTIPILSSPCSAKNSETPIPLSCIPKLKFPTYSLAYSKIWRRWSIVCLISSSRFLFTYVDEEDNVTMISIRAHPRQEINRELPTIVNDVRSCVYLRKARHTDGKQWER